MASRILLAFGAFGLSLIFACLGLAQTIWSRNSLRLIYNPPGRIYAYAPTSIATGRRQRGREYLWLCQNRNDGIIRDSIVAVQRVGGAVIGSRVALSSGAAGAWDSFHVCDPSVIAGRFKMSRAVYRYAMFYTGNDVDASRHNQIGVALSRSLDGPWTRLRTPIVPFPELEPHPWGVGQPSALSLDRKGRIQLFYTRGDSRATSTWRCEVNLSDANYPRVGPAYLVSNSGLTRGDGQPDYFNNADFALDRKSGRVWAVREQHPYPADYPQYIGSSLQVVSIASDELEAGVWRVEGEITPLLTGLPRNHNAALKRDRWGSLPGSSLVSVIFAGSCAGASCKTAEWSYDLWEISAASK